LQKLIIFKDTKGFTLSLGCVVGKVIFTKSMYKKTFSVIIIAIWLIIVVFVTYKPQGKVTMLAGNKPVNGAWCWFADPRAIHFQKKYDKTYIGWVDSKGSVNIGSYNHKNKQFIFKTLDKSLQVDDHANPSIFIKDDGHIVVFWSKHVGNNMYYKISKNPEDVSTWGPRQTVGANVKGRKGYTYPNPVQLRDENNKIYLFWRGGNYNPTYSTTYDFKKWTIAKTIIKVVKQRPYVKIESNGKDTIYFAFTEAHPRNMTTSIYFAYYKKGFFYRADGTKITSINNLPFTPHQASVVYNGRVNNAKAWVHDIAINSEGQPVIVYAVFPTNEDHRYRYAYWNGERWLDNEITKAGSSMSESKGEPNYSGGMNLNHRDPSIVYLSRQVKGVFEIEKWQTKDDGFTWMSIPITSNSKLNNYRPFSPRGDASKDIEVLWLRGKYHSFVNYDTQILKYGQ
jgi:hypothetical protein